MTSLEILFSDTYFRLQSLDWLGVVDLFLVTAVIFAVLRFIRQSRAAFLLRGALLLGILLLVVTILLPLPTFDWLLRGLLIFMLVAAPVVLQPELRRWLERVGRGSGLTRAVRQTATETLLPQLLRALENLAASQTGALIVLEGNNPLQAFIDSGIRVQAEITAELLQTIFHEKTPLHDGAIIIRGNQILAAGCVLPLTQQTLTAKRRLGTRHRAAVGLSEAADALVVVVSEETGSISIARDGQLNRKLDSVAIRQQVLDFYTGSLPSPPETTWKKRLRQLKVAFGSVMRVPGWRQLLSGLLLLFTTLVISLAVWSFVLEQTNPTERPNVRNVSLRVDNLPPGLTVISTLPTSVSINVQTTADSLPNLRAESFQASINLHEIAPGLHQLPINVVTASPTTQILSVDPATVDIELAATISQTLPVSVQLLDISQLSVAYGIIGSAQTNPSLVTIVGPSPQVERVKQVQATLSVANANTALQEVRPLRALDENGREVAGITLEPSQATVSLKIMRRQNARDVGIRAVVDGTPPEGYWLSGLQVTPANVTIQGEPALLAELGGFINTLPVDISQAEGDLTVEIPLDTSPDIEIVDGSGRVINTVTVRAQISTRNSDLAIKRQVRIIGAESEAAIRLDPMEVDLLLSGPLPLLREIEANPDLVQLFVDVSELEEIEALEMVPEIIMPAGLTYQVVPATISVTVPPPP